MDWEKELKSINIDGIDGPITRRLSPTDRKVIRQRYEAIMARKRYMGIFVSGHIDIKVDIAEFSRRLGATDEEIESDVLPSLGPSKIT